MAPREGDLAMLWHCDGCTTRYAESLGACPHCGGTDRRRAHEVDDEQSNNKEGDMPKIYADGRPPSHAALDTAADQAGEQAGESAGEPAASSVEPQLESQPEGTFGFGGTAAGEVTPAGEVALADEPEVGEEAAEPARPAAKASKADWVVYRMAQGANRDAVEALTKAELQDDATFSDESADEPAGED